MNRTDSPTLATDAARKAAERHADLVQARLSSAITAFFNAIKAAEAKLGPNPSRDARWRVYDRIEPLHSEGINNLRDDLTKANRELIRLGVE
jgi:hypothetical protein